MTRSNRQLRKQRTTTQSLKRALVELILENHGVDSITVSEITDRADFNRGTFYFHYKDKNQLMDDLYADAVLGLRQAVKEPYRNMSRVILDGVVPSTRLIFAYIEENQGLFRALDLIHIQPGLYERLEQMFWVLFTEEIMLERETDTRQNEYDIFLSYQIHATLGVVKHWIRSSFSYSSEFLCEQLTSFYSQRVIAMLIMEHK